jgi:BirA family biotin operon repressor/biotin-[acetyl-CoA-carboxylase] ligase
VQLGGRKAAGILVEGRPQEGWMVLGIGLNVALGPDDFPPELRDVATGLGGRPEDVEPVLGSLLAALEGWLEAPAAAVLAAFRARDALAGKDVSWAGGRGRAAGVDEEGRLVVDSSDGRVALDAGEVHLAVRAG